MLHVVRDLKKDLNQLQSKYEAQQKELNVYKNKVDEFEYFMNK